MGPCRGQHRCPSRTGSFTVFGPGAVFFFDAYNPRQRGSNDQRTPQAVLPEEDRPVPDSRPVPDVGRAARRLGRRAQPPTEQGPWIKDSARVLLAAAGAMTAVTHSRKRVIFSRV